MRSLRLDELTFARREGFRLGPVSLELPAGSRTALVGPSGAGKSTLLRCLAGLERLGGGRLWIGDMQVDGAGRPVPPERRGLGYVFQNGALWPHMTAAAHVRFAAPRLSRAQVEAELARVGLAGRGDRKPHQLSGGEAQRLGLARALAGGADVLLLDEPLRSVDVHLRDELSLLVRRLVDERGLTLVVVTHDRAEALQMAEHLVVMRDGRVVERGPAVELLAAPRTAYTAAFLCHAACLPAEPGGNGVLRTALGDVPRPAADGPWSLVLLPGDVRPAAGDPAAREARVLHCEPAAEGWTVHAELAGQTLRVPSATPYATGSILPVRLAVTPRLLPSGEREVLS